MTTVIKRSRLEIWRDVIMALFVREIRTGFSDKLGIGWAVLNPVAFIFILSFVRGSITTNDDIHGIPIFVFMAYGLTSIQLFLSTLQTSSSSIKKNKALFAFRQVQPISAVLAAGIFELLVRIFVLIFIAILMYILNIEINLDNPLLVVFCFICLWWLALMIGLIFGLASFYVPEVKKVMQLFTRPLFFISCVFFSLQDIPIQYWVYLDWNPVLHAIELTRFGAYQNYGDNGVSLYFLAGITLCVTFLALSTYRLCWRQAISR